MMNILRRAGTVLIVLSAAGCDGSPLDPGSVAVAVEPGFAAVPAEAHQPIAGSIAITRILDPGERRRTPSGVFQITGFTQTVSLTGSVSGSFTFVQSSSWNLRGNGGSTGSFEGTASWRGLDGGLSGIASANVHGFFVTGTFVGHGSGALAGHKFTFRLEGPLGGPFDYTGNVVSPASVD